MPSTYLCIFRRQSNFQGDFLCSNGHTVKYNGHPAGKDPVYYVPNRIICKLYNSYNKLIHDFDK